LPESTAPETPQSPSAPRDRSKYKKRDHKDLRQLDRNSPEYWEEVLRREGLSMNRGRSNKVSHVGSSQQLAAVEEIVAGESDVTSGVRRRKKH
jgi:hypothetical protein